MSYSPVPELNRLMAFQSRRGFEAYAEGFGLTDYGDTSGVAAGWSKDPGFLARLVPFAQANGTGSIYALWRVDDRTDAATLPVVVFGDEGGQHVVARDLREFFQLLAFDSKISVDWDEAYFYKADDDEPSDEHEAYVEWLAAEFGLRPATHPDGVVAAAQAEFGERFAAFCAPYLAS